MSVHQEIKRADIVQATDMVLVMMGDENGVEMAHVFAKHLLTEIRTGINTYCGLFGLDENRSAQTLVARICRPANVTIATNYGNALRSAAT